VKREAELERVQEEAKQARSDSSRLITSITDGSRRGHHGDGAESSLVRGLREELAGLRGVMAIKDREFEDAKSRDVATVGRERGRVEEMRVECERFRAELGVISRENAVLRAEVARCSSHYTFLAPAAFTFLECPPCIHEYSIYGFILARARMIRSMAFIPCRRRFSHTGRGRRGRETWKKSAGSAARGTLTRPDSSRAAVRGARFEKTDGMRGTPKGQFWEARGSRLVGVGRWRSRVLMH